MLLGTYSRYGAHSFHSIFVALCKHPCLHLPLMSSHQSKQSKQHQSDKRPPNQESISNTCLQPNRLPSFQMTWRSAIMVRKCGANIVVCLCNVMTRILPQNISNEILSNGTKRRRW